MEQKKLKVTRRAHEATSRYISLVRPNLKTGNMVDVPPQKLLYFKVGKELKAMVNGEGEQYDGVQGVLQGLYPPIRYPPWQIDRKEKRPQRDDPTGNWYEMGDDILSKESSR